MAFSASSDKIIVPDEGFSISKASFGIIGLAIAIGMALKYAELKPLPCITYSGTQSLREKCANLILKQVRNDSSLMINSKVRAILVDWLIEVHYKFELRPETLYLTMSIIDRYLSVESVLRRELQLVGVSTMLIACKYEEIWAPKVNDFICISDRAYAREQILRMEKGILNKLDWCSTFPTTYMFLKAAASNKELENIAFFYAELALMHYSMVMYRPSMIAASAIYAAQCNLKKTPLWSKTLQYYTRFAENQILDCAKHMVSFHSTTPNSKLNVVYKKYSKDELGGVALRSPAIKFVEA